MKCPQTKIIFMQKSPDHYCNEYAKNLYSFLKYSYLNSKSLLFHLGFFFLFLFFQSNDWSTAGEVSQNAGVFPFGVRRRLPILNSLSTSTLEGTAVLAFKKIFKILGKSCRFPISAHFMISSSPCPQ